MAYGAVDPGYVRGPALGGRLPVRPALPNPPMTGMPPIHGSGGYGGMTNVPNGARPAGMVGAMARSVPATQGATNPALQAAMQAKARSGTPSAGGTVLQRLNSLTPAQATAFHAWIDHATGAAPGTSAGAGGGGGAAGGAPALMLPGVQEAGFLGARDRANENYSDAIRNNQFQYNQMLNSYTPRFRDMATAQAEQLRTEPDSYVARGIFDSGIQNRGLSTMLTAQARAHSDLVGQRSGSLAAIRNARNGIERSRADAIANIEAQRQAAASRMAVGSVR